MGARVFAMGCFSVDVLSILVFSNAGAPVCRVCFLLAEIWPRSTVFDAVDQNRCNQSNAVCSRPVGFGLFFMGAGAYIFFRVNISAYGPGALG